MHFPRDVAAGMLFTGIGAAFASGAISFQIGTAARMGPGFFPLSVGLLLVGLGAMTTLRAIRDRKPVPLSGIRLGTVFRVLLPIVAFALLLRLAGLPASVAALVVLALRMNTEATWLFTLGLAALLAAVSTLIFGFLLGLPLPLSPPFVVW